MGRGKVTVKLLPSPDLKNSKKKSVKWTLGDNEHMLNELLVAKKAGEMTENSFKKKIYAALTKKLGWWPKNLVIMQDTGKNGVSSYQFQLEHN